MLRNIFSLFIVSLSLSVTASAQDFAKSQVDEGSAPQYLARRLQKTRIEAIQRPARQAKSGGELRFLLDEKSWQSAPTLSLDYQVSVAGMIARMTVTQRFSNPSDEIIEAEYTYPLPAEASVDGLLVKVGEREIHGVIKEKQQAQRAYEAAKSAGKRAALLQQQSSNLFMTRISHIEPGQEVEVQIELQQEVHYEAGVFSLVLPSTLTPRYMPGVKGESEEKLLASTAGFISTPVAPRGQGPKLSFAIRLAQGFELADISSESHALSYQQGEGFDEILPHEKQLIANRDVQLSWTPVRDAAPTAALFYDEVDGEKYGLLMVLPAAPEQATALAREVTFVMDESGSMLGASMEQAKLALQKGLKGLTKKDSFNLIAFDDGLRSLYSSPQPVSDERLEEARAFADQIEADGGTEMIPALNAAFSPSADEKRVAQVVFVTDGAIGNESELLKLVHQSIGERRLFPVGIGSAPNAGFMREAARFGRGSFTNISSLREVEQKMTQLTEKLQSPLLKNLEVKGAGLDMYPRRLPDLYAGEPLVISFKLPEDQKSISVSGERAGKPWRFELSLMKGASLAGVQKLYGKKAVQALLDQGSFGVREDEVKAQVVPLALELGLVTPYTSLVAIEKTPSFSGAAQKKTQVASAAPHGSELFGNMPQTATPLPLYLLISVFCFLGAFMMRRGQVHS